MPPARPVSSPERHLSTTKVCTDFLPRDILNMEDRAIPRWSLYKYRFCYSFVYLWLDKPDWLYLPVHLLSTDSLVYIYSNISFT